MAETRRWSLWDHLRIGWRGVSLAASAVVYFAAFETRLRLSRMLRRPFDEEVMANRYLMAWSQRTCRYLLDALVLPRQPPPVQGACLVVCNHRTSLDIPVLLALFGGTMVSRAYVDGLPLVGEVARRIGVVFVDARDPEAGQRAVEEMRALLQDGRLVTVFAEGGTHAGDEVRRFATGFARASVGLDVPVIPVGLALSPPVAFWDRTLRGHAADLLGTRGLRVAVAIGTPSAVEPDRHEAAARLRGEVQALVDEARGLL